MTARTISFFDLDSGESRGVFSCSDMTERDILLNQPPNTIKVDGEYSNDYYYKDGILHKKSPKPDLYYDFNIETKEWVFNQSKLLATIRAKRNQLLESSDWTQLPDVPPETKTAWATYRQQLRDITAQADPFNITWPIPPNA
jgi:hypothetical protein